MFTYPKSLQRQILWVFGIMLLLGTILVVVAFWELDQAQRRMREITARQSISLRTASQLASLTQTVSTDTANLLLANDATALIGRSGILERELNEIQALVPQLLQDEATDSILDLQLRSQAYSTVVNVVLQLRQQEFRDDDDFRERLRGTISKARSADGSLLSESELVQLAVSSNPAEIEKIKENSRNTTDLADDALVLARQRQLTRLDTLRRFSAELRDLGAEMTLLAQNSATAANAASEQSMATQLKELRTAGWRLAGMLTFSLATGFLLVGFLLQRGVLRRIEIVSSWLRGKTAIKGKASIPVVGGDEIADMARSVENFLEDRQQLVEAKHDLEIARKEAEQASQMKSKFLANITHEIRTPMNAILGYSQLLRNDPTIAKDHLARIEPIHRAGEHLLSLINDVLEMSKIEAGQIVLNETTCDLHALLSDLIGVYGISGQAKGLKLVLNRTSEVPRFIVTDEGKLRQCLLNLLSNAVKFSSKGSVTLSAAATHREGESVTLRFAVTDTGPGLSSDEIQQLFRPFVQCAAGLKSGGTGLGLAISKQHSRILGGDITVQSQPGHGATFTLTIRARVAYSGVTMARSSVKHVLRLDPKEAPVRILVVDNLAVNRELLVAILEPIGFETKVAVNGAQALEIFQSWKPQAILMDMRMPVMDGFEANRRIKATATGREAVIIALTSSGFEEDKSTVLASGADVFMRKPFNQDELLDAIGKHLKLQYVYESPSALAPEAEADLSGVPHAMRADLLRACKEADYDQLVGLCNKLAADGDAATATALRKRVNAFDYESIAQLLAEPSAA